LLGDKDWPERMSVRLVCCKPQVAPESKELALSWMLPLAHSFHGQLSNERRENQAVLHSASTEEQQTL